MESSDINLNLFGIYIINYYLKCNSYDENSINNLTQQINNEYLSLFTSLLNKGNKKLSFIILIILINVTFTKQGEMLFGEDENVMNNIATFLGNNKNDMIFLEFGILFIKHITCKNSLVKQILYKFKIIDFFNEIYQKFLLNSDIMEDIILTIGHFINSRFSKNKGILCSINIIKSQLNKKTPFESLVRYFNILFNLVFYNDPDIIKKMIDEEIHIKLMDLFPFDEQSFIFVHKNTKNNNINDINIKDKDSFEKELRNFRLLIIKILGKMLYLNDDNYIQKIIDSNFSQFLNKLLKLSDIKIIKNTFYCIQNIFYGTYGQISNLYDNNTVSLSLQVAKNVYEALRSKNQFISNKSKEEFVKTLREIDYSFSLLIINSLNERLIPVIKYDNHIVLLFLLEGFKFLEDNKKDNELISLILRAISKLLDYFKKNDDENNDLTTNFLVEFLEKNGFKEILEKLQYNSDENIMENSEIIFDEYFDNSIGDNSDKININDIIGEDENKINDENEENYD